MKLIHESSAAIHDLSLGDDGERTARDFVGVSRKSQSGLRRKAHNSPCCRRAIVPPWKAGRRALKKSSLRPSGTVLAFDPPILLNMVLITIIHSTRSVQPLAILLSVLSALVRVVLGLLITGVPLGLMTLLVALTRIVVRVLYLVVFGVRQGSATLTEPTPTPQSCTR